MSCKIIKAGYASGAARNCADTVLSSVCFFLRLRRVPYQTCHSLLCNCSLLVPPWEAFGRMRSNRLTVLSISFAQKEDVSFLCTPKCHNGGGDSCAINGKEPLEAGVSAQWAGEERCHGAPLCSICCAGDRRQGGSLDATERCVVDSATVALSDTRHNAIILRRGCFFHSFSTFQFWPGLSPPLFSPMESP